MVFVFSFKLLKSGIAFKLSLLRLLLNNTLDSFFVFNIFATAGIRMDVRAADVENLSSFAFFGEEFISEVADGIFSLNLFKLFIDSLSQGEAFLLLAHDFIYLIHVLCCAFLLSFFGHTEYFLVALANMFNKSCSISNKKTFNGIDERAGSLVETVGAADLKLTVTKRI
jgi:hypothetical protein